MISLVKYYEEKHNIYEAKFKNLSEQELDELNTLLASVMENKYDSFNNINETECIFGNKYFIEFNNPFKDINRYSATPNKQTILENEPSIIRCIGIGDKFGRIFLEGVWDNNEPAYIEYKKSEQKITKSGKVYITEGGWYLTRKDINAYKVKTWKESKSSNKIYIANKKPSAGAWGISLDIKHIKLL